MKPREKPIHRAEASEARNNEAVGSSRPSTKGEPAFDYAANGTVGIEAPDPKDDTAPESGDLGPSLRVDKEEKQDGPAPEDGGATVDIHGKATDQADGGYDSDRLFEADRLNVRDAPVDSVRGTDAGANPAHQGADDEDRRIAVKERTPGGDAPSTTALERGAPGPELRPARFGSSETADYRSTFFQAHPETEGRIVVHHAVEQQARGLYPSVVSKSEVHSLENLRGIPLDINNEVHLREIRKAWNGFYKDHPMATKQELLDEATKIDDRFGKSFDPPVR